MRAVGIRTEGPRYRASLLFVPGLWSRPDVWREPAAFLAHRGWAGEILDPSDAGGGLAARASAMAAHVGAASDRVVIAHDAGAAIALGATALGARFAAMVLVAPLLRRDARLATLVARWDAARALLTGAAVPPPPGGSAWRPSGAAVVPEFVADDPAVVLDVVRGRFRWQAPGCPTLLVGGGDDPFLPPERLRELATSTAAEVATIPGAGHWPQLGGAWTAVVSTIHRWLVTRLGEDLLETYADAMAERDDEGDG